MKMKMAFDEKDSHENIPPQMVIKSNKTCKHLLSDFADILTIGRWHKNITGLRVVIDEIASKCTSSDYDDPSPNGSEMQCAICVVVLRVIDNYVSFYKKNVT